MTDSETQVVEDPVEPYVRPLEPGALTRGCPSAVAITEEERGIWIFLTARDEEIDWEEWRVLEESHAGPHHALAPFTGPASTGSLPWWLRWDDDRGRRDLAALGFCEASDPNPSRSLSSCSHPLGHSGRHQWDHDPDCIY